MINGNPIVNNVTNGTLTTIPADLLPTGAVMKRITATANKGYYYNGARGVVAYQTAKGEEHNYIYRTDDSGTVYEEVNMEFPGILDGTDIVVTLNFIPIHGKRGLLSLKLLPTAPLTHPTPTQRAKP